MSNTSENLNFKNLYDANAIGRKIALIRKKLGWSLYKLQLKSDVSRSIIKDTESGKNKIRIDNLLKIINGFNMSPAEFFQDFN